MTQNISQCTPYNTSIFSRRDQVVCNRLRIGQLSNTFVSSTQRSSTTVYTWPLFFFDRPMETPPSEVNAKGVAKYSDLGPFEGYISVMV